MAIVSGNRSLRQLGPCIALALHVIGLSACAGHEGQKEASSEQVGHNDPCGRLEAAGRFSLVFFDAMGEMGEACSEGDVLACNPANYVIGGLAGVVFMPMGFAIGLASPEIEQHHCARKHRHKAPNEKPETEEQKWARLQTRAAEGDAAAQYELAEQLSKTDNTDQRRAAWYWYCSAAHLQHAEAQYRFGGYYRTGRDPVAQDLLQAYLWYELAADQKLSSAAKLRTKVAARLSARQIATAERLAAEWQPNSGECSKVDVESRYFLLEEVAGDDR